MKSFKITFPFIPIIAFFILWQILAQFELINTGLFSGPLIILNDLKDLFVEKISGRSLLISHIYSTIKRLFFASIAGSIAGLIVGIAMGLSNRIYNFFDPIITIIMPIPGIAMVPLFIVWLGFGDVTIISVGAVAAFFPIAYNTSTGVRSVDIQLVRAAQIMGIKRIRILFQVYIPWSAVYLFTGIKLGLARCWRTVIAAEFIAAANFGIGYMIWDAAEYLNSGVVYGGIIILAFTFTIIEKGIINTMEHYTIEKWGMLGN